MSLESKNDIHKAKVCKTLLIFVDFNIVNLFYCTGVSFKEKAKYTAGKNKCNEQSIIKTNNFPKIKKMTTVTNYGYQAFYLNNDNYELCCLISWICNSCYKINISMNVLYVRNIKGIMFKVCIIDETCKFYN